MNNTTRRILRIAIAALVITAAIAFAQNGTRWQDSFAAVLGGEISAVMVDCVDVYGTEASDFACLETDSSAKNARWLIDLSLDGFSDVEGLGAWERLDSGYIRTYIVNTDNNNVRLYDVGVMIDAFDDYNSYVLVAYGGLYDAQGNEIRER